MAPPGQEDTPVELTYNWDGDDALPSDSRHFGHLAYRTDDIYALCQKLMDAGVTINRPPRDGHMAFAAPTTSRSSCCRTDIWTRRSRGPAWKTPGIGKMRAGPAIAIGIGVLVAIFVTSQGRGQNDGRQDSVQHDTGRA